MFGPGEPIEFDAVGEDALTPVVAQRVLGYDLLNEPLLRRYEGISESDLRRLYVLLTETIREVDPHGIIFVEGDDWAQNFRMLEPIDWDPHLVLAFHSYPPTASTEPPGKAAI